MRLLIASLVFLSAQTASADLSGLFIEKVFVCTINSFTTTGDDIEANFTWSSMNQDDQGSHGGSEKTFTKGKDEIVAIGNDAWMGLAWWRNGKKIAESVTVITERNADSRVLLVMHPDNDEERIHMDCSKPSN